MPSNNMEPEPMIFPNSQTGIQEAMYPYSRKQNSRKVRPACMGKSNPSQMDRAMRP